MASHVRSNSLPSKSHPEVSNIDDQICRLKSSQEASVSSSSICTQLVSIKDLHEEINNLIQLPSARQALISQPTELLDGSLELVDMCGLARDVILLTKESVADLESSLRRNRGIDNYVNSRKKIEKMVKKCLKSLRRFDQCFVNNDCNLASMVKAAQAIGFSILKSAMEIFASKQKSWSLVSRLNRSSHVHSQIEEELYALNVNKLRKDTDTLAVQNVTKHLKESEMIFHELEENLEAFFRTLIKTRVSLLNVLL